MLKNIKIRRNKREKDENYLRKREERRQIRVKREAIAEERKIQEWQKRMQEILKTAGSVVIKGREYKVDYNDSRGYYLPLHHRHIEAVSDIKGLANLSHLKELDLSSNNIKKIEGLENLYSLEELTLRKNQITDINEVQFLYNSGLGGIRLDLRENLIIPRSDNRIYDLEFDAEFFGWD